MVEYVNVNDIVPAEYNPRKLSVEAEVALKESILKIGFCIPILVNKANNTIIAGHQRTRCAKALGIEKVPCIYVSSLVYGDEIKFNQFHNGVECKSKHRIKFMGECPEEQFTSISNSCFEIDEAAFEMPYVKEICKLILKYGNVFSAVICNGHVWFADEYVYACQIMNLDVNVYRCKNEKQSDIQKYFSQDYGVYSYADIERNTYVQGLAQMFRSVDEVTGKKQNKSILYETMVQPFLKSKGKSETSILDFGCGKGAYIGRLAETYNAIGVEFYNNNGSAINVSLGNRQINALIEYLKERPVFDVVVCDSVMNSVDSKEAENAVVACLNLFAKEDMFISGRTLSFAQGVQTQKRSRALKNYLYFYDADGFTANYRKGQWYFQKFHTEEQMTELLNRNGFEVVNMDFKKSNSSFRIHCRKVRSLSTEEYIKAIDFEFNLPLPHGRSYGRNEDIKQVLNLK